MDIGDVDILDTVSSPILSLGKLLRAGFDFHFSENGKDCYATSPGGAHKFAVELGDDDILRLPHEIRHGNDADLLPVPARVTAVRRTVDAATAQFLHDTFNHCSMDKIYNTLGVTKGYDQVKLPDPHCNLTVIHVPKPILAVKG